MWSRHDGVSRTFPLPPKHCCRCEFCHMEFIFLRPMCAAFKRRNANNNRKNLLLARNNAEIIHIVFKLRNEVKIGNCCVLFGL